MNGPRRSTKPAAHHPHGDDDGDVDGGDGDGDSGGDGDGGSGGDGDGGSDGDNDGGGDGGRDGRNCEFLTSSFIVVNNVSFVFRCADISLLLE